MELLTEYYRSYFCKMAVFWLPFTAPGHEESSCGQVHLLLLLFTVEDQLEAIAAKLLVFPVCLRKRELIWMQIFVSSRNANLSIPFHYAKASH